MNKADHDLVKRRPDQPGTLIGVRLQPDALAKLDAWIAQQPPHFPHGLKRCGG
jgi:hypothetical protein